MSWLRQLPSASSGSSQPIRRSDDTGEDTATGQEAPMVEASSVSGISVPLYLFESSRTSGQGTLVKCCPPRAPFPGVILDDSGDRSPF